MCMYVYMHTYALEISQLDLKGEDKHLELIPAWGKYDKYEQVLCHLNLYILHGLDFVIHVSH